MLKGKIKKFSQELYDKYDIPARNLMKQQLGENNVIDNPDIYGEDMIITNEKCNHKYLELQVCAEWYNDNYPYEKPFVFERKGHFSEDTLFIIFDKNFKRSFVFKKKHLNEKPVRMKKYSKTFIYTIEWNRVYKIDVKDLCIEQLIIL